MEHYQRLSHKRTCHLSWVHLKERGAAQQLKAWSHNARVLKKSSGGKMKMLQQCLNRRPTPSPVRALCGLPPFPPRPRPWHLLFNTSTWAPSSRPTNDTASVRGATCWCPLPLPGKDGYTLQTRKAHSGCCLLNNHHTHCEFLFLCSLRSLSGSSTLNPKSSCTGLRGSRATEPRGSTFQGAELMTIWAGE